MYVCTVVREMNLCYRSDAVSYEGRGKVIASRLFDLKWDKCKFQNGYKKNDAY